MSLTRTHKEHIINKVLLEYLKQGIIPNSDDLEDAIETYQATHPNLSEPKSKYQTFEIEHGAESSASVVNDTAEILADDIGIVVEELHNLVLTNRRFYERWSYELQRLLGRARQQEHDVDSLLLLEEDTAGFFAHVSDVFADLNQVDTSSTTARVNIREGAVTINPDTAHPSGGSALIDLTDISEQDISFVPLTRRAGTTYAVVSGNTQLSNILKTDGRSWVGMVSCKSPGPMIGEITVKLSKSASIEASRVMFEYTGSDISGTSTVTLQYSTDGYTWFLAPTDLATRTLASVNTWYFPLTSMRWLKLIINKKTHDHGQYNYDFAARSLRVLGQSYSSTTGNILVTRSMNAKNAQDETVEFSSLSLEVCEEIPKDTDIQYYLAASADNSTWSSWFRVSPANREKESIYPAIVGMGGLSEFDSVVSIDSLDDTIEVVDNTLTGDTAALKLTRVFSSSTLTLNGYNFPLAGEAVINTAVEVGSGIDPTIIGNTIAVWRNIYYRDPGDLFAERTVREIPGGWGFKDGYYHCAFEVLASDGTRLDFGDHKCILDDQEVSGVVVVPKGIHKFRTLADYWHDIDIMARDLGITDISNEGKFKELDPLYPHNHKLTIEGFPYSSGFEGEKVYRGAEIVAEEYGKKVSLFDLENNIDPEDYKYFAIKSIGTASAPVLAIVVRYNTNNSDYTNELCRIKWKTSSSLYRYVKMKAVLTTEDTAKTPLLTSYRLKLGY